jgi:hypothetical protein
MVNQILVDYFIKNPKQLKRSAGKFVRGERGGSIFKGTTIDEVNASKVEARKILDKEIVSANFFQVGDVTIPENSITVVGPDVSTGTVYNYSTRVNNESGDMSSEIEVDYEPKSVEELAELHKIDLNRYKISTYWSKLKSNGKFTSSILASLKKPADYSVEDFANFLNSYQSPTFLNFTPRQHIKYGVDVEMSIADFHLAKATLERETIQDKKNQYLQVVGELLSKSTALYSINKIVFPISNDFFHTDNYQNQTTNGTPQDVLVGYDTEYEEGFDLLVKTITILSQNSAEVEVVLVQGNHDRTKSFYLAHALEVYFKNLPSVKFKREHSTTKFTVLGNTFIGYHHGNCKIDDLPLIFATNRDSSQSFGICTFREVHTGDKHHYMAKEVKGVRIQQMPSLSGTDRWHADNNYVNNIRAGIATIYHPAKGRIAEFESRI